MPDVQSFFDVGDLLFLEVSLLKFMDGLDIGTEAARHCSGILGKCENNLQAIYAAAQNPHQAHAAGVIPMPDPPG